MSAENSSPGDGGFLSRLQFVAAQGIGAPILVILLLAMMVIPLPPIMLDLLFTFNIAISLIIVLVVIYILRPLDFGAFPTVLLVATLLRLALNIASTRVVLLEGHTGGAAAGKVIESFGEFVIGGNFAVGLVVFAILMVINFVVVTKGAGRISEVSARFVLDAMPGKQMAIDADLGAGLIDSDTARTRRDEISNEAEFYGSMDGASKFVRGDAIAGLIILFINIFGGLFIGMLQHNLSFSVALERYVLLTIGDGLVAQIPSMLLSTASAVIITRVSAKTALGSQFAKQMFDDPRPLAVTAGILLVVGMVPGMPNLVFLTLGGTCAAIVYWLGKRRGSPFLQNLRQQQQAQNADPGTGKLPVESSKGAKAKTESADLSWNDVKPVDIIGLEVGYGLIPLVDKAQGGELMNRIKGVRKKLSQELGFLVQPVHIHDNLSLDPNSYRITILGVTVGESNIYPNREMAINPGSVYGKLDGFPGRDPAFDLEAMWISANDRDHAQALGYTVVDASTVVATHLSQLLRTAAPRLFGFDETQQLLDGLAKSSPRLVDGLVPDSVTMPVLVRVLQALLEDGIPLRDMRTIIETIAEHSVRLKDAASLLVEVRAALGRMIVQQISGQQRDLAAITLEPALEQLLLKSLAGDGNATGVEPGLADRLLSALKVAQSKQDAKGERAALLTPSAIRQTLARWLRHAVPGMSVLAYNEVPEDWNIRIVSTVGA